MMCVCLCRRRDDRSDSVTPVQPTNQPTHATRLRRSGSSGSGTTRGRWPTTRTASSRRTRYLQCVCVCVCTRNYLLSSMMHISPQHPKTHKQDTLPKEATSLFLSSDSPLVRELFTPTASSPASPARGSSAAANKALRSPPPPGGGDAFLMSPGGTSVLAAASVGGQFKQQVGVMHGTERRGWCIEMGPMDRSMAQHIYIMNQTAAGAHGQDPPDAAPLHPVPQAQRPERARRAGPRAPDGAAPLRGGAGSGK